MPERLKEELLKNLKIHFFEDEEADEVLRDISGIDKRYRQKALALCLALSSFSSNLVPRALMHIRAASACLTPKETEKWIEGAFDLLDSKGLEPAMSFLSRTDEVCLLAFAAPEGLRLETVSNLLETFLKGISGMDLNVAPNKEPFTDTSTVYLPSLIDKFKEREKNFLLYKLMAVHNWALIKGGSLSLGLDTNALRPASALLDGCEADRMDIETLFSVFPDKEFALGIYGILEAIRLEGFLQGELPGLMKEAEVIKEKLYAERPGLDSLSGKAAFVEGLYRYYLKGALPKVTHDKDLKKALKMAGKKAFSLKKAGGPSESVRVLFELYNFSLGLKGDHNGQIFFLGSIKPERVSQGLRAKRKALKKRLEAALARLISAPEPGKTERPYVPKKPGGKRAKPEKEYLVIKGNVIELDEELRELIEESGVPGGILVKGSDLGAGTPAISLIDLMEEDEGAEGGKGGIKYDEWDFKRGDYRKKWCSLFEEDVHPSHEPFVEGALKRYGGYVGVLRKKFELMRREPKTLRRQRDGEDIDIDAVVESFSDTRAGLSAGEGLFTKLDRVERNIAVLFLLDMSGSTKGWINEAEKEALVLMCEALEGLGDRYAIYGFSGNTRNKCDFYKVKSFEEGYTQKVKSRIAGIAPKDYTRMGPPLRHSARILSSVEARTKLLITLSDGKPEDYDAYKGDYGIEDTRRALTEAKEKGIHSFCITIDREASSYLPHMYGEVNYIFIDDVRKLPNKITEIYRRLTT